MSIKIHSINKQNIDTELSTFNEVVEFIENDFSEKIDDFVAIYYVKDSDLITQVIVLAPSVSEPSFKWQLTLNLRRGGYDDFTEKILDKFTTDYLVRSCLIEECYDENLINKYLKFGFVGISPNCYGYFPSGIVYRIDDLTSGKFYIGETFKEEDFLNEKYNGTGTVWSRYYNKHRDDHIFKRTILRNNFKTPAEMYDYEVKEIRKYCKINEQGYYEVDHSTGCMNLKTHPQNINVCCPECGASMGHRKWCSKYNPKEPCPECGSVGPRHKKWCSKNNFKQDHS